MSGILSLTGKDVMDMMSDQKKPVKPSSTLPARLVNYLAAQGFLASQGFLAAQGLRAEQGFC
ncbi:MAG: hypothetical protein CVV06_02035 [Gammaproteobacteria bacterium HGW-Gammaproteobacteria-10]|nr:MAG: hypothetical protein CVV06_02035 [Gammaproteobacteria bacterium HGW-Gammaproteobacteria-10]